MKNELYGKTMTEFVALMAKMHAYRKIGKKLEDKRWKGTKKWDKDYSHVVTPEPWLYDYKLIGWCNGFKRHRALEKQIDREMLCVG